MTITITDIDYGAVELSGGKFRDETITFGGADTFAAGTILARRRVATAVTASAVTGTGDGTVTLATVVAGQDVPIVGAYTLTCLEAVTHGGIWQLKDPNGAIVADYLQMTAGSGVGTVFEVAGLQFTITDGAADFVAGDTATLTVAADGTLVPFLEAGAGGVQHPVAVLTYASTRTGAGTNKERVLVAGEVQKERLIIDADGDASNVNSTVIDRLIAAGIVPVDTQQLGNYDTHD